MDDEENHDGNGADDDHDDHDGHEDEDNDDWTNGYGCMTEWIDGWMKDGKNGVCTSACFESGWSNVAFTTVEAVYILVQ